MVKIEIYYASVCGLCTKAIEFFRSQGLTFTAHAVEWDGEKDRFVESENSAEMYKRCKEEVDFVPQIFIGDTHIKGWRKLEPMIKSGEFNKLIKK
jgi:glutaredoxin